MDRDGGEEEEGSIAWSPFPAPPNRHTVGHWEAFFVFTSLDPSECRMGEDWCEASAKSGGNP